MRISRRSSGGRGEYEISESAHGVTPTDLLNRRLILDFGGGIGVDTNAALRHQGGKFRVRLLATTGMHPHRQAAAALMMPQTIREDKHWGRGAPVMRTGQYSLDHIQTRCISSFRRPPRRKVGTWLDKIRVQRSRQLSPSSAANGTSPPRAPVRVSRGRAVLTHSAGPETATSSSVL